MNIKRLANNLYEMFQRKQDNSNGFLNSCRASSKPGCKVDLKHRVSSKWTTHDERKISVTIPNPFKAKNKDCIKEADELPIKINCANDYPIPARNSYLPPESATLVKEGGGPMRPGLLRAGPLKLRKSPKPSFQIPGRKDARDKLNLPSATLLFSSSSPSSEYYDDRSAVFGGWFSDSSSKNSFARLRLKTLGSSDSDRSYGGEEGAKPAFTFNDRSLSQANNLSEGSAELEIKRPQWTPETDDLPEVVVFFTPSVSGHSSSSIQSHLPMPASSKEKRNSLLILPPCIQDREDTKDSQPCQDCDVEGLVVSKKCY